jgi:hypothetical protein
MLTRELRTFSSRNACYPHGDANLTSWINARSPFLWNRSKTHPTCGIYPRRKFKLNFPALSMQLSCCIGNFSLFNSRVSINRHFPVFSRLLTMLISAIEPFFVSERSSLLNSRLSTIYTLHSVSFSIALGQALIVPEFSCYITGGWQTMLGCIHSMRDCSAESLQYYAWTISRDAMMGDSPPRLRISLRA